MSVLANTIAPCIEDKFIQHFGLPDGTSVFGDGSDVAADFVASLEGDTSETQPIGFVPMFSTTDGINRDFLDRLEGLLEAIEPNRTEERKREDFESVMAHADDVYEATNDVFEVVLNAACKACGF